MKTIHCGSAVLPENFQVPQRQAKVSVARTEELIQRAAAALPVNPRPDTLVEDVTNLLVTLTTATDLDAMRQVALGVGLLAANTNNALLSQDGMGEINTPHMVRFQSVDAIEQAVRPVQQEADKRYQENMILELENTALKSRSTQFPIHLPEESFHKLSPLAQASWKKNKFASSENELVEFINWAFVKKTHAEAIQPLQQRLEDMKKAFKGATDQVFAREAEIARLKGGGSGTSDADTMALGEWERRYNRKVSEAIKAQETIKSLAGQVEHMALVNGQRQDELDKLKAQPAIGADGSAAVIADLQRKLEHTETVAAQRATAYGSVQQALADAQGENTKLKAQLAESSKVVIPAFTHADHPSFAKARKVASAIKTLQEAGMDTLALQTQLLQLLD